MIEEIAIRDLGVIGEATLELGPGFTAVTGETGAGKTMVVTALGLLRGERSDSGVVRAGAAQASVEGRWLVPVGGPVAERVREAGGDLDPAGPDDAELVLGRSVSGEGRSRAFVGGRSAPAGVLADLADDLVVVHGQSDQMRLRSSVAQREALDRFAGAELRVLLGDYRTRYERWRDQERELERLRAERDSRSAEAETLRAALAEIEEVDPQPEEDDRLAERADLLSNLEDIRSAVLLARESLSAEEPDQTDAVVLVDGARRQLERVAVHDAELVPTAELVASAEYLLQDAAAQLSSYLGALDEDAPSELAAVQDRRAALAVLTRKYGATLADVLDYAEQGSRRLLELDGDDDRIDELTGSVGADEERLDALAADITAARTAAAQRLAAEVSDELGALAMPDARLVVDVDGDGEKTPTGRDAVQMRLAPHPGAEPRPLGRGASGGELSRVMLAIEVVMASTDPVPTFVFDEVDAGVGGAAAIEIGRRLARLARTSQVIVVTHLAQVAAFAQNHLGVVKDRSGSVTSSSVTRLTGADREAEMARLLSGLPDSQSGLAHARELLDLAEPAA